MNYQSILAATPTLVVVTGGVLLFLLICFIFFFLIPGTLHWFRLGLIQRRINKFESKNFASEFTKVFSKDKRLSHLWKEYQDSLHKQSEERDGQLRTIATRATVPSELYFNRSEERRVGKECA